LAKGDKGGLILKFSFPINTYHTFVNLKFNNEILEINPPATLRQGGMGLQTFSFTFALEVRVFLKFLISIIGH